VEVEEKPGPFGFQVLVSKWQIVDLTNQIHDLTKNTGNFISKIWD